MLKVNEVNGGLQGMTVKNEIGARLAISSFETVLLHAMDCL